MNSSTPMDIVTNPRLTPKEALKHLTNQTSQGDKVAALMIMSWIEMRCWEALEKVMTSERPQELMEDHNAWSRVRDEAWEAVKETMEHAEGEDPA